MRTLNTPVFVSLALFALFVSPVGAQTADPLFVVRSAASATTARDTVGMRLDRLFGSSEPVVLNVGDRSWTARVERIDADVAGHRVWVGRIDGIDHSHVSFAERQGVVSGLINAVSEVYVVRTVSAGSYAIEQAAQTDESGRELEPLVEASHASASLDGSPVPQMAADDRGTIDVLLLYTPRAVARVGGTAQMQALVAQIISDSNTIFNRSNITTRLRLAGAQEFPLAETSAMSSDLTTVTNSAAARSLRDQSRADLVQLLEDTNQSGVCGIAWLLTSLGSTNFNGYSVADVDCVGQYTPTHEMGHNMGSHHAPEDDASFALFPYSFGYKDPARGFRTVMAYSCAGVSCPRIPNMSNPAVTHNGGVTGSGMQNNALSINNAAETVANFRQRATATAPSAPTGLRSQVNGGYVTLSWNAVTSDPAAPADAASSYLLNLGSAPGLPNIYAANVGNTTSVTGLVPAGTYFWRVFAVNSAGQSGASAESTFTVGVCAPPGAPQNFAFSIAGRVVTLTWSPPGSGSGPLVYSIEAGSASGLANLVNIAVGGVTSLSVEAPPGTYFVRVRAQNACGAGGASAERVIVVP